MDKLAKVGEKDLHDDVLLSSTSIGLGAPPKLLLDLPWLAFLVTMPMLGTCSSSLPELLDNFSLT